MITPRFCKDEWSFTNLCYSNKRYTIVNGLNYFYKLVYDDISIDPSLSDSESAFTP